MRCRESKVASPRTPFAEGVVGMIGRCGGGSREGTLANLTTGSALHGALVKKL